MLSLNHREGPFLIQRLIALLFLISLITKLKNNLSISSLVIHMSDIGFGTMSVQLMNSTYVTDYVLSCETHAFQVAVPY